MKVILRNIEPDDWILGIRAAKWLKDRFQKDAIIAYGEGADTKDFYAKRNANSTTITVSPCSRQ